MTLPLLVGQAPGPRTSPDLPLFPVPSTSAGGRLQQLMDITRGEYLKRFERTNVLRHFPGKHKRDDKFPMAQARAAADAMRPLLAGRRVILIGRNVANAFGMDVTWPWHTWRDLEVKRFCLISRQPYWARFAVVPHPSGRSRWYNDDGNKAQARDFWTALMAEASEAGNLTTDGSTLLLSPVQGSAIMPSSPAPPA